ncbi:MAG: choice-of-anchor Q domain-containing protein, partial [Paludibacter sp.]
AFSTRYLVQGTTGTNTWRTAGAGEINVTTSDFSAWYYETFSAEYVYDSADEIWLAGGTYMLNAAFGSRKVNVYGGFAGTETSIAQRSKVSGGKVWDFTTPTVFDGNLTTAQGYNSSGIATTPNTYIDGVTITRCKISSAATSVYGVGAFISKGCVMQNCIVKNNTFNGGATSSIDGNGGGIYLAGGQVLDTYIYGNQLIKGSGRNMIGGGVAFAYTSETALNTLKGCTIENNICSPYNFSTTTYGGGICVINGVGGTIDSCIVKGNFAGNRGAGLGYTNATTGGTSTFSVKNCQFIENTSSDYGGGVGLNFGTAATVTFENNQIIGNIGLSAGGMYLGGGKYNPIKNCVFRDNKSTSASGASISALYTNLANLVIQNCVFANNSSTAATNNCTLHLNNATQKLYNCTFANNNDPGTTGYTLNTLTQTQTLTNNVFWGNVNTANINTTSLSISNYNATTADKNTTAAGGSTTGNITTLTVSPNNTFVSPTLFTGVPSTSDGGVQKAASAAANWSMLIGSPAVDSGTDLSASPILITTDILGNTRPLGNAFDRGAYERSSLSTDIKPVQSTMQCYSAQNSIELRGLTIGESVMVYGISGNLISSQKALNSSISISLPQGIYLVRATDKVNKVIVR